MPEATEYDLSGLSEHGTEEAVQDYSKFNESEAFPANNAGQMGYPNPYGPPGLNRPMFMPRRGASMPFMRQPRPGPYSRPPRNDFAACGPPGFRPRGFPPRGYPRPGPYGASDANAGTENPVLGQQPSMDPNANPEVYVEEGPESQPDNSSMPISQPPPNFPRQRPPPQSMYNGNRFPPRQRYPPPMGMDGERPRYYPPRMNYPPRGAGPYDGPNPYMHRNGPPPGGPRGMEHRGLHPNMDPSLPPPAMRMPSGPPPGAYPPYGHFRGHPPPQPPPAPGAPSTPDIWVENVAADGRSYYYSMSSRETCWTRPENVTIFRQEDIDAKGLPALMQEMKQQQRPPQPPVAAMTPSAPRPLLTAPAPAEPKKPPEVAAWAEYKAPDGRAYYHNATLSETTWEKPKVLNDWEQFVAALRSGGFKPPATNESAPPPPAQPPSYPAAVKPVPVPATIVAAPVQPAQEPKPPAPVTAPPVEVRKEPPPTKKEDPSKPISSTPVVGTPWCVVWTGDGRVFFFNPSQHLSVWEKPDELKGREDVDAMLEQCPAAAATPAMVSSGENGAEDGQPEHKKPKLGQDDAEEKQVKEEEEEKPQEEEEEEEARKESPETEENGAEVDGDAQRAESNGCGSDAGGTPIPVGMEAAKVAVEKAKQENSKLPLEERVQKFREMLVEKEVCAFTTWEKELHKIVFDPRYLLLTTVERRQVFEEYTKDRAEEERRERKLRIRKVRDDYRALLEQSKLHGRSVFEDFVARASKDERYKAFDKPRERESYFNDYVDELRRAERENRIKARDGFIELLKEQKQLSYDSKWSNVKGDLQDDPRYKALDSAKREDLFKDHVRKLSRSREHSGSQRERARREREEASLREREKAVKEELSSSLRERDKGRSQHLRAEAQSNLRSLLNETIKEAAIPWKEARKTLRQDVRWDDIAEALDKTDREEVFKQHQADLLQKHKEDFRKLLHETRDKLEYSMTWKAVRKLLKNDSRYDRLADAEVRPEHEYQKWWSERLGRMEEDFGRLLDEAVAERGPLKTAAERDSYRESLVEAVKADARFTALDKAQNERDAWLTNFVAKMATALEQATPGGTATCTGPAEKAAPTATSE